MVFADCEGMSEEDEEYKTIESEKTIKQARLYYTPLCLLGVVRMEAHFHHF